MRVFPRVSSIGEETPSRPPYHLNVQQRPAADYSVISNASARIDHFPPCVRARVSGALLRAPPSSLSVSVSAVGQSVKLRYTDEGIYGGGRERSLIPASNNRTSPEALCTLVRESTPGIADDVHPWA